MSHGISLRLLGRRDDPSDCGRPRRAAADPQTARQHMALARVRIPSLARAVYLHIRWDPARLLAPPDGNVNR